MAAQNPMDGSLNEAFPNLPRPVSKQVFTVAGITIAVYGLNELISSAREVACLWLLHPRLQTQACMEPLAAAAVSGWNERKESETMGLLAITFDQRNHGSREIDPVSNEAWRSGNKQHAQDMFSIYRQPHDWTTVLDLLTNARWNRL